MHLILSSLLILQCTVAAQTTRDAFLASRGMSVETFPDTDALGNKWIPTEELLKLWGAQMVDRIDTPLSVEEFQKKYIDIERPVILSGRMFGGIGDLRTDSPPSAFDNERLKWTWEYFRDEFGDVEEDVKFSSRHYGQNCSLKMLCPVERMSMRQLVSDYVLPDDWQANLQEQVKKGKRPAVIPYLRDLPLQTWFPDMLNVAQFARYFQDDLLSAFQEVTWPTAFFAPAGSRSEIHNDYGASAFTMTPMHGRKEFALFPYRHETDLQTCEDPHHNGDPDLTEVIIDVWNPDFKRCPRAVGIESWFARLYPGDVLYVPPRWMHAIRNLDANVGITRNFISLKQLDPVLDLHYGHAYFQSPLDRTLLATLALGEAVQPVLHKLASVESNPLAMTQPQLKDWNRRRIADAMNKDPALKARIDNGLGALAFYKSLTELAQALGYSNIIIKAKAIKHSMTPLRVLNDHVWTTEMTEIIPNANDRAEFESAIERRVNLMINYVMRKSWSGKGSNQLPDSTDNTFQDALGEEWLDEEEVVAAWPKGKKIPIESSISPLQFRERYASKHLPVVLRGSAYGGFGFDADSANWNWERFRDQYGEVSEVTKWSSRHYEQNCSLGLLCEVGRITMKDLVNDFIFAEKWQERVRLANVSTVPYLRDLPLVDTFTDLYSDVKFSTLIEENFLTFGGTRWPTAFFGPAGSRSELHHDYGGTAFTMTPLFGRKAFALFPWEDETKLMRCGGSEPIMNVFNPDFTDCEQARDASAWFATLYPGDVLYVPSLWMHAIRNLDANVGITRNFVSIYEIDGVLESLDIQLGKDFVIPDASAPLEDVDLSLMKKVDFLLGMAFDMARVLSTSDEYLTLRNSEIRDPYQPLNASMIAGINKARVFEAMQNDPHLKMKLDQTLAKFGLWNCGDLFTAAGLPETAFHPDSMKSTPYFLLQVSKPEDIHGWVYNLEDCKIVLDYIIRQKLHFLREMKRLRKMQISASQLSNSIDSSSRNEQEGLITAEIFPDGVSTQAVITEQFQGGDHPQAIL